MWSSGQCHQHSVPSKTGIANSNGYRGQVGNGNEYTGQVMRKYGVKSTVKHLIKQVTASH